MYKKIYLLMASLSALIFTSCSSKKLYTMAINHERHSADLQKKSLELDFGHIVYLENNVNSTHTLVLIHGLGADKDNWNRFVSALKGKYHVIVVDLPGHGESVSRLDLGYSLSHQVEMLWLFLQKKEIENIHLIGNSMGGAVALQYAYTYKLASLILIDSLGMKKTKTLFEKKVDAGAKNPFFDVCTKEALNEILNLGMQKPPYIPGVLIKEILAQKCARGEIDKIIYDEVDVHKDLSFMAKELHVATLILWGKKDKILHVDNAQVFHENIKGSRVHIFETLGHVPMFEDAKETVKIVLPFLKDSEEQ